MDEVIDEDEQVLLRDNFKVHHFPLDSPSSLTHLTLVSVAFARFAGDLRGAGRGCG